MSQPPTNGRLAATRRSIDYDIHGVVGVRLINPTEQDARAVVEQLGPAHDPLTREPDIVIRFQKELPIPDLKFLGLDAGFNEDGYYLLSSSKADARVRIPLEDVGGRCEIICQSGLRSVPLLIAIVNLTFLKKGYLPLHASAFLYNDIASVVMGWSKGGKTEALLSFANHGARYVADEWTIFSEDGERMFGIAEPIRLWDWQFRHIPRIQDRISGQKKILFNVIHSAERFYQLFARGALRKFFPIKVLGEALPAFKRQLNIRIQPHDIFEDRFTKSARPDKLFLIMSHDSPEITVERIDSLEIARRMKSSNEFEQFPILEHYKAFRFAFPERRNEFLEQINHIQAAFLERIFADKEAYRVLHPYPVVFEDLYRKMKPYCEQVVEKPGVSK